MRRRLALVLAALVAALFLAFAIRAKAQPSPNRFGCGTSGGPGWRAEDGHCVSAREMKRVCGDPPEVACVYEGKGEAPPLCEGCGCRGGPGWRGPDKRCVGWREMKRKCGDPPGAPCTFEGVSKAP